MDRSAPLPRSAPPRRRGGARAWLGSLLAATAAAALAAAAGLELLGPDASAWFALAAAAAAAAAAVAVAALALALLRAEDGPAAAPARTACALVAGAAPLAALTFAALALTGRGGAGWLEPLRWAGAPALAGWGALYLLRRRALPERTRDHLAGWIFMLPAVLLMLAWVYLPAVYALWISLFRDFDYLGAAEFVGLQNYAIALRDPLFLRSLLNTLWYVLGTVPAGIALGFLTAVLLNEPIRGVAVYRLVYFLPYITALTAAAAVWRWIYNPASGPLSTLLGGVRWLDNPNGVFALALAPLGLEPPALLAGPSVALVAIMIMSVWHFLGYNTVIFLAGLQGIPREIYEAARIDGAGWGQQLRFITWPLLAPTTFFVLIIGLIGSLNVFTQILILTPQGGVLNDTVSVVMYLYFKGFRDFDFGYASALAFLLFVLTLALTLLQRRMFAGGGGADALGEGRT